MNKEAKKHMEHIHKTKGRPKENDITISPLGKELLGKTKGRLKK